LFHKNLREKAEKATTMFLGGRIKARLGSRVWFCMCAAAVLIISTTPGFASGFSQSSNDFTLFNGADYPPFLIGPGDILTVSVYGEKDFPDRYLVESSGKIVLPLAGEVKVAGLTQAQAGAALARHLLPFERNPQVTVLIAESNNYNVSILGAVAHPGKYPIHGKADLLDILADSGGPTDQAALNNAVLIRRNRRISLPLKQYLLDTDSTVSQPLLYPGDVIVVPETIWPSLAEWGIIASIITSGVLVYAAIENRP
jgi:polysaccharide export outer membrane protein